MKRIQNKLYLGLAVIGLSAPLHVYAAGQDSVVLGQDGNQVAVSLEMSNASEEKITTVAVSLEVRTDDPGQVTVEFRFAPELGGTEHGFVYNEDTGRLDIYVASSKSLFSEEKLNLGNVQVQPVDPSQSVAADIGYCPNSFQTANGSYGDKAPVVEGEVEPVSIQVGNGTLAPAVPDTDPSGSGNTDTGSGSGSSGNNSSGSSNRDQGLYDDTTRFTNDPSSAQKIDSSIVSRDKAGNLFQNLSAGAAAAIGGKGGLGANAVGKAKAKGKVSVISPENGPASILVSKGKGGNSDENQPGSLWGGGFEEKSGGNAGDISGESTLTEDGPEEIMLDQKNGGAVDDKKSEKRKQVIMISTVLAGVVILAGGVLLLLIKMRKKYLSDTRRKKKRRRRRRRRAKKPARRPERPTGRKKVRRRKR